MNQDGMVDQSEFEAAMTTHLFDQMASASAFDQMGASPESHQALLNQPQALVRTTIDLLLT